MSQYGDQQGYEQAPQYGQQGQYSQQPHAGYGAPGPTRSFGVVGAVVALLGTIAVVLAFTALDWYRKTSGNGFNTGTGTKFSKIHDQLDQLDRTINSAAAQGNGKYVQFGISKMYFGWLAWVLLAVAVVVAIIAVSPSPLSGPFRVIGLIVGLAAAGLTVWALELVTATGPVAKQIESTGKTVPDLGYYLKHSAIGAWLAIAGFVIIGIGALLGSRRRA